jgi:pimeloyl-ACP methyl ester carboxylesterase
LSADNPQNGGPAQGGWPTAQQPPAPYPQYGAQPQYQGYPQQPVEAYRTSSGPPKKERRKGAFDWLVLLVIGGLILTGSIFLISNSTGGVNYKKVSFTTAGLEEKPVTISGLLVTPKQPAPGIMPGVVFAHGITGSKEWYIQMARPIAEEGIPVLMIDLRGHGGSTGSCTFCDSEPKDMWAAADYMKKNVPGVDPNHIVAMGHSLGGIAATRAGALQPDRRFSAVVAIYCWSSWKDAIQDLTGPIDAFVGRSWQFVSFSKNKIDINAPDVDDRFSITKIVNTTNPPNYMLAVGRADELESVDTADLIMQGGTAGERGGDKLKDGVTYGDFASGTARKLVLTDDDHLTEMLGGVITRQAIDWIRQDAGLPVNPDAPVPFLWLRVLGIVVLMVGLALIVMGVLSLVRRHLFKVDDEDPLYVKPPWGEFHTQGLREVLLYAGAVVGASYLAMPLAKALGISPFIPYAGVNEMSTFFLARSILLLPIMLGLLVIIVMRMGLTNFLKDELRPMPARYAKNVLYAIIPVALVMVVGALLVGPLLLPRVFPVLPGYMILGTIVIAGGFWIEDYLFYKLAYPAMEIDEEGASQWLAIIIHGLLLDAVIIAAFLPLMTMSATFNFQNFHMPLLLSAIFGIPFFMFLGYVSMKMRRVTGSSLAFALMFSSIAVFFLTGPIGVRGF